MRPILLVGVFMRITEIELEIYKSIKEPVKINFYDGLPTVLIGKNGSGKTNILEALNAIAEANGNYYGLSKELSLSYKAHIILSKEDTDRLFPGKDIDGKKCQFIAYSDKKCKIGRIESEYLVPLLKSEVCEINNLANELKDALDTYTKQLHKIAYGERKELSVRGFQITDFQNSTTNYDVLKFKVGFIIEQAEKLAVSLMQNFDSDDSSFQFGYVHENYRWDDLEKLSFKLCYVKPDLALFEEKFININETALKREITKINNATKGSCDKITALLHKINEQANRLKGALTGRQILSDNSGVFYQFIGELQKCIGARCIFLQNESSNVLFQSEEQKREYYRNDKSSMILQTYLGKVYDGDDKGELLKQIQGNEDFSLSDEALSEFEDYLNSDIPKFEAGMYDCILVEHSGGKIPTILLHEKSGETVSLNATSAGRRWYFTYYFMKNMLEPGDLFLIDEPAAMLHPVAQKELLNELLNLEKQGINVVYSTHSPYLIPSAWECVHFVLMGNKGTSVTQENRYDFLKQVTGGDIFNLQELLEKYQKSDEHSVANRCYRAIKNNFDSIESAAKQLNLSVPTIESWRKNSNSKKFRSPKLENILLIAEKTNTNILELLQRTN